MSVPDLHARSKIKRSHGTPWRLLWEGGKKEQNSFPSQPSQITDLPLQHLQGTVCRDLSSQEPEQRESEHRVCHMQWEKWWRFEKPGLGRPGSGPDLVGLLFPPLLKRESVYNAVLGAPSEIHVWKEVSSACYILMSFVFFLLTDSKACFDHLAELPYLSTTFQFFF